MNDHVQSVPAGELPEHVVGGYSPVILDRHWRQVDHKLGQDTTIQILQ
jgi:hypothetical protein